MNEADLSQELRDYLVENIPLSLPMGVAVVELSRGRSVIKAPLDPNRNHKGTAFGGSLASLMILAAWSWIWAELKRRGLVTELVIQSAEIEYLKPVQGEIVARCETPDLEAVERFISTLQSKGKARIAMQSSIVSEDGKVRASLTARFASLS